MERRPISVNLRNIKIKDIKTVIFTTLKVVYINADNNIIILQAHKDVPYRNPSSIDQVMGFKDGKEAHFCKPSQN